jgi:hypothetical protein
MGFFDAKDEQPKELKDIEAYILIYDIPDDANLEPEDKRPQGFLRTFAFHAQLSGWVVQRGDLPHAMMARWIKFDAGETGKLLEMAVRSITAEINERHRNAASSYADAIEELQEDEVDADSALTRFRRKSNQILNRLEEHLTQVRRCAERWGVLNQIPSITTSVSGIRSLRQVMKVRAAAYRNAIEELRKREDTDTVAIANGFETGQIPATIVADYMDDLNMNGEALRSAYFE